MLDAHRPEERFRIYRVRDGQLACVCSVERIEHVGGALADQRDPEAGATLTEDDRVGILDAAGLHDENPLDEFGCYTLPGYWLSNPWARG